MINFLENSWNTVANGHFLLITILLSVSCKLYFLGILIPQGLRASKIQRPWFYLLGILAGSLFGDLAWIIKLIRELWIPSISYDVITFFIRLAWGFLIVQYQSLSLFIESLTEKKFTLTRLHKTLILIGGSFSLYFFIWLFLIQQWQMKLNESLQNDQPAHRLKYPLCAMPHIIYLTY